MKIATTIQKINQTRVRSNDVVDKRISIHKNNLGKVLLGLIVVLSVGCKPQQKLVGKSGKPNKNQQTVDPETVFRYHFLEANRYKIIGKYSEALTEFKTAATLDPKCGACYFEIAGILDEFGVKDQALTYAEKAFENHNNNKWIILFYADINRSSRNYDKVLLAYEKIIELNPEKVDYKMELAQVYLESRQFSKALEIYQTLEDKYGVTEDLVKRKHKIYSKEGNNELAGAELLKLVNKFPNDLDFQNDLADFYETTGKEEEAVEIYKRIIREDPSYHIVHLSLAEYYRKKDDLDNSFLHLNKAFINPEMGIETKMRFLRSYYKISEDDVELTKKTLGLIDASIEAHGEEAQFFALYGDFMMRDDSLEKARDYYLQSLDMDVDNYNVWRNLLAIDTDLKDFKKLVEDAERALEYYPTQPEMYWYKGLATTELKQYEEAIQTYHLGVDVVVGNDKLKAQFYSSLGDIYNEMGNFESSDQSFEMSLSLDSDNVFVLNNYSYYLSLRKEKLDLAEEMSLKSNTLMPNNSSFEDTYGWVLFQAEKYDLALEWLQKAETHGGASSGVILEHIGDSYSKLNNVEKALEYWNNAKQAGGASEKIDQKISEKRYIE